MGVLYAGGNIGKEINAIYSMVGTSYNRRGEYYKEYFGLTVRKGL